MKACAPSLALPICVSVLLVASPFAQRRTDLPIAVRPATLAQAIEQLAGSEVNVSYARVVGVLNPHVLVIDTAALLRPPLGRRDRLVVLIPSGALKVSSAAIVGSTVRVTGVARTLLGVQVTREVPWPDELRPEVIERLEIRAAVLATSIRTADGVELTSPM
jgi:hypothetical protein